MSRTPDSGRYFSYGINRFYRYPRYLLVGARFATRATGLCVSHAAWLKRHAASESEVAAGLGDKSTAMGAHYTCHVEAEANAVRTCRRRKDAT
jgi:hypothetical protein